jgi:hypothetical protein
MAIVRTKILVLLETVVDSLHRISMAMRDLIGKRHPGHLIRMWEFGYFECRFFVEGVENTFLVGTLLLRH